MKKAVEGMKKLANIVRGSEETPAKTEEHDEMAEMKANKAVAIKKLLKSDLEEAKAKQTLKKELQNQISKAKTELVAESSVKSALEEAHLDAKKTLERLQSIA